VEDELESQIVCSSANMGIRGEDQVDSAKRAVVLLSGGLDSATTAAIALHSGFEVHALSFAYGQRHASEIEASRRVAQNLGVASHSLMRIDLRGFGGSALTADIDVPKGRSENEMATGIPVTYVPARNTIFLSFALAFAEVKQARDIFIGVNAVDYSGYPDCRPEFIAAFQALADLATAQATSGGGYTIHAPLQHMTKSEIIAKGIALGVDYSMTTSCYDPDPAGAACGHCDSCQIRLRGFAANGLGDPIPYVTGTRT